MARQAKKRTAPTGAVTQPAVAAEVPVEVVEAVVAAEPAEPQDSAAPAALADPAPVETAQKKESPAKAGGFPGQYRVTNNSRMALSLPIVDAQIAAASFTVVAIRDEAQMKALRTELDTLAQLNRFGKDVFVIAPQDAQ